MPEPEVSVLYVWFNLILTTSKVGQISHNIREVKQFTQWLTVSRDSKDLNSGLLNPQIWTLSQHTNQGRVCAEGEFTVGIRQFGRQIWVSEQGRDKEVKIWVNRDEGTGLLDHQKVWLELDRLAREKFWWPWNLSRGAWSIETGVRQPTHSRGSLYTKLKTSINSIAFLLLITKLLLLAYIWRKP